MLSLTYFPIQWKYTEIIMIAKPKKPENAIAPHTAMSLLPIASKIFINRIKTVMYEKSHIPLHQSGF